MFVFFLLALLANTTRGQSPLEFQYRDTQFNWPQLGPAAAAGNGLFVAYNGSHTRVLNASRMPNSSEYASGDMVWELVNTTESPPNRGKDMESFPPILVSLGNGKILMYGGGSSVDAWVFSVLTAQWTRTADGPLLFGQIASLGNGKVLMYGGFHNVTYVFSLSTAQWTKTTDGPSGRFFHRMASLGNGSVLMYGGTTGVGVTYLNDAWVFSLSSAQWTQTTDGPYAYE
jgi:hypothetical protein